MWYHFFLNKSNLPYFWDERDTIIIFSDKKVLNNVSNDNLFMIVDEIFQSTVSIIIFLHVTAHYIVYFIFITFTFTLNRNNKRDNKLIAEREPIDSIAT